MRNAVLVLVLVIAAVLPASADDNGFFVGLGLGFPTFDPEDFNDDLGDLRFEEDSFGLKFFGGYRFGKYLAAEVSYNDFGSVERHEESQIREHQRVDVGINSIDASVMGIVPLGTKACFFGKAGFASWNTDITVIVDDLIQDLSTDGTDVIFGLGVDFIFKKVGLRMEYDFLDIADTGGAGMFTGSLTYRF